MISAGFYRRKKSPRPAIAPDNGGRPVARTGAGLARPFAVPPKEDYRPLPEASHRLRSVESAVLFEFSSAICSQTPPGDGKFHASPAGFPAEPTSRSPPAVIFPRNDPCND